MAPKVNYKEVLHARIEQAYTEEQQQNQPKMADAIERARTKAAAKELEVLVTLAQGLATCQDEGERESLRHQMQLSLEGFLPGAKLAKAAPIGEAGGGKIEVWYHKEAVT